MSAFEVMYGRPPPMLSTYEKGTAQNEEVERELMARDEVVAKVKKELEKAQGRMKKYYDQVKETYPLNPEISCISNFNRTGRNL